MADTAYPLNHPAAVKHWTADVYKEALKRTYAMKFMGRSPNSLIQLREEAKSEGDRIRTFLRLQLKGEGVEGDGTLEGNEEELSIYHDDVYINQLRHAVRSAGRMSEQRVPFSVREESRDGLADWWADRIDTGFFNQIAGNTNETRTKYTGMQAATAPTASRVITYTHSTTASLSAETANQFGLTAIDACVELAETDVVPIRPVSIAGSQYYCMFVHNYQFTAMKQNAAAVNWFNVQRAIVEGGGQWEDNPIFTGAAGYYNKTLIHVSSRVPEGVTGVRRAIFCGAQSASIAFGNAGTPEKTFSWVEELFDFQNKLGVSAGSIWGLKKMQYDYDADGTKEDFGTIVVASSSKKTTLA